MNNELNAKFAAIFVISMVLGLSAGNFLTDNQIRAVIVDENPDSPANSVGLLIWMLVATAIILAMLKFAPGWLSYIAFKIVESLAVFSSTLIVLLPYNLPDFIILGFGIGIVLVRLIFREDLLLRNITSTLAAAGAGALIGASLGTGAIALLVALLAIYDYIAVFKTKHMVALAKGVTGKNLAFTFAIPTKEKKFELGTGDIVIPLAFAVAVLAEAKKFYHTEYALLFPGIILFSALLGLVLTLEVASRKKIPLPALPVQSAFMIAAFLIIKMLFF